jgi:hypothetical protein
MSANEVDFQPDTEEVLQMEPEGKGPVVDVTVSGPVRTQELPRRAGATFTRTVGTLTGTTPAVRVLTADHKRARAVLMSVGQNMLVAFNQGSAQDASRMILWPANSAFVVTTATEVWVAAATGTTSIGVATELWATGSDD